MPIDPYRLPPSIAGLVNGWLDKQQEFAPVRPKSPHPDRFFSDYLDDGELPTLPPTPSTFKPEPFVNNPATQKALHEVLRLVPRLRDGLGSGHIQTGPDVGSLEVLDAENLKPEQYGESSLSGTHYPPTHDISINPRRGFSADWVAPTLLHELMHASGFNDTAAYDVGGKSQDLIDKDRDATAALKRQRVDQAVRGIKK